MLTIKAVAKSSQHGKPLTRLPECVYEGEIKRESERDNEGLNEQDHGDEPTLSHGRYVWENGLCRGGVDN